MFINFKETNKCTRFEDVKLNDLFTYNNNLYIKLGDGCTREVGNCNSCTFSIPRSTPVSLVESIDVSVRK